MSSAVSHMLIGAAGGVLLHRWSPDAAHVPLLVVVVGSALLATWPDIDEPNSWIGRRAQAGMALLLGVSGGIIGYRSVERGMWPIAVVDSDLFLQPLLGVLLGIILGLLCGIVLAHQLLRALQWVCGGHRGITHSLVLSVALGALAVALAGRAPALALVLAALVWGQLLHLVGDVVTPSGVALLFPCVRARLRLPRSIATVGEPLAVGMALFLAWAAR